MRLFVSIDLPPSLASSLADVQDRLSDAPGLRFVDPEQAHVTVKFLGDTDPVRLSAAEEAIATAVDDADVTPFEAHLSGLGVFPSLDYISVVWAGVEDGSEEMTRLHEAIERETTAIGFSPDRHEFTPHVTLARMSDARGKDLVTGVVTEAPTSFGRFRVEQVRLKESTLTPEGSTYQTVSRFAL
ncbi:MAG: RNA 2',3'-cyclic phosphodiesterase [Halobacteriota archaeon]